MYAVVLTGRLLPGCSEDEVWAAVATKFNLGMDVLKSRVLHRAPVSVREFADLDQAQRMQSMLMHCGAESDLVPTDGVRWQLKDSNGQKGPVPREFLRVALARRMFVGDVLVRRGTEGGWLPLESVAESASSLADASPAAAARSVALPPPLPDTTPAMTSVEATSAGRHMPPPLPLPPAADTGHGDALLRNVEPINASTTSSGGGKRVIAAAVLLLLGACGFYLFNVANEALSISCDDQEVVDTAKSVLYRALGPKMGAVSGGFGLPMSEERVRQVVSLELVGVGTMRREGNVLECLAILKAVQSPNTEGDVTALWRGVLIADLDDKPIRYNVIKADDGQHFTVTMSQQE